MSVIGFDIGNLNCYIAVARAGGIETIANEYSDRCTPAYVSFGESRRFVGASAKNQIMSNSKNTISNIKRLVGRRFDDPYVQLEIPNLPFEIVPCEDGSVGVKVKYLNKDEVFSAEQVFAMLLSELKKTTEQTLGTKIHDCVISVPSFFTDYQRRALLTATHIAGLNCLKLLNETTAVALSYGLFKKDLPLPKENPRNVVFVDVGNSACQVSVCSFNKGKIKVLCSASDPMFGGRNFDFTLREYFGAEFLTKYKVNAKSKTRPWIRLLTESEKMKKLMSANATELPMSIECFMDDKDVTTRISRTKMEELVSSQLQNLEKLLQDALQTSGLTKDEISSVEVVGGSSRVPAVKEIIQRVYEKELCFTLNADEAVAKGCAIQCAMMSPTFKVRDIDVTDSTPYPINISWKDNSKDETGEMEIFSRNHSFPATKVLTLGNKESLELSAYYSQNTAIPHTVFQIGNFRIKDLVPTSSSEPAKIKVKVRLDPHGILTIPSASIVEQVALPVMSDAENKPDDNEPMDTSADTTESQKENGTSGGTSKENADQQPQNNAEETATPNAEDKKDDNKAQENNEENNQNSDAKDASPAPAQKKPKKQVKTTELSVESSLPCVSPAALNLLIEKENEMVSQIRLEKERADAFNSVEEYVYDMRDKINNQYEKFITEEDREKFSSLLSATEDWLYDEGEGETKKVYVDKLAELKKYGQPVVDRCQLHGEIPTAFNLFGQSFIHYRKILDKYANKDETIAHIEEGEMAKVAKKLEEKETWMNSKMIEFSKTATFQTPNIRPSEIMSAKKLLEDFCNPIVNKPKPKAEPPKEEKKDSKNGESGGEGKNNKSADSQSQDKVPEKEVTPPQQDKKDKDLDMEVD